MNLQDIDVSESRGLKPAASFDLSPHTLDEALRFSEILSKSDIVPKDFINKPGNILVAIQWGMELGLKPMQAMQNIAVINGRPSLWGDACMALVRSSPVCDYIYETDDGTTATCRAKRKGSDEEIRTFSIEDAAKAGLANKPGPWTQYPKRMRQMRARAFALRDVFADVLKGMPIVEEVIDYAERDITPRSTAEKLPETKPVTLPDYSDESFGKNFATWETLIQSGKKTADAIIAMVSSKANLSEEQKQKIKSVEVGE
jgi:hypothetical protein